MSLAGHAQTAIYFSSLHLNPVLVQIGPFALRWYSLAYISGILLGWFYLIRLLAEDGAPMTRDQADGLVTWVTAGIIIGGRLAYVLFYDLSTYVVQPWKIFQLWAGGMSFHGGAFGVAIAIIIFARSHSRGLSSNGTENLHKAHLQASSIPTAPGSRSGRSSPRATMSGMVKA